MRKSYLTNLSFRNTEIFFPGHIRRCPASILLYLHIASTHGQMLPQFVKISTPFTHPKWHLSKMKFSSYAVLGSFNPLCIPHGFPTPSPLTKNRALFASTPIFSISTMLVRRTPLQPLPSTKLSMVVPDTRIFLSWMGSPATIKSKSISQISIKPLLLPHGELFLSCHTFWSQYCRC